MGTTGPRQSARGARFFVEEADGELSVLFHITEITEAAGNTYKVKPEQTTLLRMGFTEQDIQSLVADAIKAGAPPSRS